jgi:hypothetical protein
MNAAPLKERLLLLSDRNGVALNNEILQCVIRSTPATVSCANMAFVTNAVNGCLNGMGLSGAERASMAALVVEDIKKTVCGNDSTMSLTRKQFNDKLSTMMLAARTTPRPTRPTISATPRPTLAATQRPTLAATPRPTLAATQRPTLAVTRRPTLAATQRPTLAVTQRPTLAVTRRQTLAATPRPALATKQAEQQADSVTGQPTVPPTPGITIDLTIDNDNTNTGDTEAEATGGGYGAGGVVPVVGGVIGGVVVPGATAAPAETEEPSTEEAQPDESVSQQTLTCPSTPTCPDGLAAPGTFFCMSKRTLIVVVVMILFASILAGVGYYLYRRSGRNGAGANAGRGSNAPAGNFGAGAGGAPGGGFGDLGGFDLGAGPGPR